MNFERESHTRNDKGRMGDTTLRSGQQTRNCGSLDTSWLSLTSEPTTTTFVDPEGPEGTKPVLYKRWRQVSAETHVCLQLPQVPLIVG